MAMWFQDNMIWMKVLGATFGSTLDETLCLVLDFSSSSLEQQTYRWAMRTLKNQNESRNLALESLASPEVFTRDGLRGKTIPSFNWTLYFCVPIFSAAPLLTAASFVLNKSNTGNRNFPLWNSLYKVSRSYFLRMGRHPINTKWQMSNTTSSNQFPHYLPCVI